MHGYGSTSVFELPTSFLQLRKTIDCGTTHLGKGCPPLPGIFPSYAHIVTWEPAMQDTGSLNI